MPRKAELPIELIPEPESVQGGSNFLFVLAVLVLVIILGYFVYKLFNKFSEMSSDIALMKSVLIKITGTQEEMPVEEMPVEEQVEEESIVEIEEEKPKEDSLELLKENNSKLSDIDEESD
jgi:hypothetical protein